MQVTIFHPNGTPFKEVLITDRSMRKRTLMDDNYVQLYLESSQNFYIVYNSFIEYEGERFYTMQSYRPLRIKGSGYIYEIKFCGIEMLFANDLFFRYVTVTTPTCKEYKEPDFVLNCNLTMMVEIMLTTLNKEYSQYQWTLYTPPTTEPPTVYPKATPLKNLAFSGLTVLEVLNRIAKEFETEWWIEQDENPGVKILHFDKCEQGSEYIELSRSYHLEEEEPVNGGLKDFSFDQSQYVIPQKIYAYGSERNIQARISAESIPYHTRLQLPLGREYIEIENHTTKGSVVKFFEEVYPTLRGTVTEMRCGENNTYLIKDAEMQSPLIMTGDQKISVYFDSGILQGYTFQVDIIGDFLELHTITSGSFKLPNSSLSPSIGDHFSLFNVELPLGAIHQAQQELLAKTIDYVNELANRIPRIACTPHPIEFRKKVPHLSLGLKIRIKDPVFQGGAVQARISEYQYPLNQKHLATFYLDNAITHGKLLEMKDFISKLDREVIDTKTLTHHSVSMNSETGAIISQTLQYEILTDTPSLTPRTTYVKANSIKRFSKGPTSYPAQLGCICYFTDQDPQTLPAEESGSDFIRVKVPQASIVKMVFFQKSDDPVLKRLPDKELLYIQDGLTPSINEHNYWVIGKDVTEVSAIGAPNQSFTCPNFNIIYDPVGKNAIPPRLVSASKSLP